MSLIVLIVFILQASERPLIAGWDASDGGLGKDATGGGTLSDVGTAGSRGDNSWVAPVRVVGVDSHSLLASLERDKVALLSGNGGLVAWDGNSAVLDSLGLDVDVPDVVGVPLNLREGALQVGPFVLVGSRKGIVDAVLRGGVKWSDR